MSDFLVFQLSSDWQNVATMHQLHRLIVTQTCREEVFLH